jgi:hypothetical protein
MRSCALLYHIAYDWALNLVLATKISRTDNKKILEVSNEPGVLCLRKLSAASIVVLQSFIFFIMIILCYCLLPILTSSNLEVFNI